MEIPTQYNSLQYFMQWSCQNPTIHIDTTKQPTHFVKTIDFQHVYDHLIPFIGTCMESLLNGLSIESKNTRIRVQTKKLWSYEVRGLA